MGNQLALGDSWSLFVCAISFSFDFPHWLAATMMEFDWWFLFLTNRIRANVGRRVIVFIIGNGCWYREWFGRLWFADVGPCRPGGRRSRRLGSHVWHRLLFQIGTADASQKRRRCRHEPSSAPSPPPPTWNQRFEFNGTLLASQRSRSSTSAANPTTTTSGFSPDPSSISATA